MASVHPPPPGNKVCVVGAGPIGLVTIKNLTEQGLAVTAFERDGGFGGTWLQSEVVDKPMALPTTVFMNGKNGTSYTDFPMGDDYPAQLSARHLVKYFGEYASHFELQQYIVLHTAVIDVRRDEKDTTWLVQTRHMQTGEETRHAFDRVVIACGNFGRKRMRYMEAAHVFAGTVLHSCDVRDTVQYKGKNVLVVGGGPTAVDYVESLHRNGAATIYISHGGKFRFLPESFRGYLWDDVYTLRTEMIISALAHMSQIIMFWIFDRIALLMCRLMFPALSFWPSFFDNIPNRQRQPHVFVFFNDYFLSIVEQGQVEIKAAFGKFTGPRSVVLADGEQLDDVDAVIVCSGYHEVPMPLSGPGIPTDPALSPERSERLIKSPYYDPKSPFPRLYHGLLSETWPESLACVGRLSVPRSTMVIYDVATMALASVWSGKHPLPEQAEMKRVIDARHDFVISVLEKGPIIYTGITLDMSETYWWWNEAAGTGINERLGSWGLQGWKFWLTEPILYEMIMDGAFCPAVYRLFETGKGRRAWPGARQTIVRVQQDARRSNRAWKQKVKREGIKKSRSWGEALFSLSHWRG
ncbi:hypothetical protein CDD81_2591 [Ophiocordyceps australis]|uniref:FAD/NAD(P)-binding domain-containing protein n=1 Tax=Ophiocordyceps australis TaxID=1399860 RepID=A0A2C5XTL3_9HYPO|nr:hypothetical protein CDD81_2591 [Ophiocordyceps australis]